MATFDKMEIRKKIETVSEEQFDKMKEKAFQNVIEAREEEVNEIKQGFETIDTKFREIENKIFTLKELKNKKRTIEKYAIVIFGAIILFLLFVMQMILLKERDWKLLS